MLHIIKKLYIISDKSVAIKTKYKLSSVIGQESVYTIIIGPLRVIPLVSVIGGLCTKT